MRPYDHHLPLFIIFSLSGWMLGPLPGGPPEGPFGGVLVFPPGGGKLPGGAAPAF